MPTTANKSQDEQNVAELRPGGESLGLGSSFPKRANYWGEISIEEKIERLRELVKSLVKGTE
jgi:hypothetical protein